MREEDGAAERASDGEAKGEESPPCEEEEYADAEPVAATSASAAAAAEGAGAEPVAATLAPAAAAAEGAAEGVDEDGIFRVRNLDTGEVVEVTLEEATSLAPSSVPRASAAWAALKEESRGLLEKLASAKTLSFRSYQLCVWQERYVYAEDDALCYRHLSANMQPEGPVKRILYVSIEFVGPFDDTQFVLKTQARAYTFLCDSTATRTMWIKNISQLAGCSATTEVCHKTTSMGQ